MEAGGKADEKEGDGVICWDCRHAVPSAKTGCSWSRNFEPVPGWKAKKCKIRLCQFGKKTRETVSYEVRKCPQFEEG